MKIIIPMAGMGKRMRPHTLTIPKPLLKIAGKPIVQRLAETLTLAAGSKPEEIAFIIGDFGKETEEQLLRIAETLGAKGRIYYQHEPLGTAHALMCAAPSLEGEVIVAFADTLFRADIHLNQTADGMIWVKKVEDPSAFGVVTMGDDGFINGFSEKPRQFVSDLAIIGVYYFRDGAFLKNEMQYLLDNKISKGGEYQLTDALFNMMKKGARFCSGEVQEWLDCGNKDATVYANKRILETDKESGSLAVSLSMTNSVVIPPCYIAEDVSLENSVIGPGVSLGKGCQIKNSVISESIIQQECNIQNTILHNSMIGSNVILEGRREDVSIGDFTRIESNGKY